MERDEHAMRQAQTPAHEGEPVEKKRPEHQPKARHREQHEGGGNGMVEMARENVRMHLAPVPMAVEPHPHPFPPTVLAGAIGGLAIGAIAGVIFGTLLLNGTVVVPGWEQLYSMTPGTFRTFWLGMGAALGLLLGGVGTILIATPGPPVAQPTRTRAGDDDSALEQRPEPCRRSGPNWVTGEVRG